MGRDHGIARTRRSYPRQRGGHQDQRRQPDTHAHDLIITRRCVAMS